MKGRIAAFALGVSAAAALAKIRHEIRRDWRNDICSEVDRRDAGWVQRESAKVMAGR